MKIILNTSSTNPEFNGDCDYALADLTPALVEQIRQRAELARQIRERDDDLYEMYFWGSTAEFYNHRLLEACQEAVATSGGPGSDQAVQDWMDHLEQGGHALVPPGVNVEALEPERTECNQIIIRCSPLGRNLEFEVAWITMPKHSDINVTTRDLPLSAMDAYLRRSEETPA
jgi:hypothetical protein